MRVNIGLPGVATTTRLPSPRAVVAAAVVARAAVVAARAVAADAPGLKAIEQHVVDEASGASPKKPLGCRGDSPIAFGGGEVVAARAR